MRPSEGRFTLWPLAVLAIIIVLVLLSFDLPMRLREDTPQHFRTAVTGIRGGEDSANAYWELAVTMVQWKYPFGSALPQDAPPEFVLPVHRQVRDATRQQYWNALRQVWPRPEVWHRRLEFDVSWAGRAVHGVLDFLSTITGHAIAQVRGNCGRELKYS